MKTTIDYGMPAPSVWEAYAALWRKSHARSVFQSPSILRVFARERIAFVIGLAQKDTLIYHSLTFNPAYSRYSPGKVLLLPLSRWMRDHGLHVLDFGHGDEPYKYRYANKSPELNAIFISRPWDLAFVLRATLTRAARHNRPLIRFYRTTLRPLFRKLMPNVMPLVSLCHKCEDLLVLG